MFELIAWLHWSHADARSPHIAESGRERRRETLAGSIFDVGLPNEPRRERKASTQARIVSAPTTETTEIQNMSEFFLENLHYLPVYDEQHCRRTQHAQHPRYGILRAHTVWRQRRAAVHVPAPEWNGILHRTQPLGQR